MIHLLISIWKMLDWQHSLFHSFHNLAVTEGQPLFCSSNHIHVFCWVAAAAAAAAAPAVSVAVTVLLQLSFECITPLIIDTARALLQLSVFWCSPFYRCCFGADFYFTFIHFILTTLLHSVSFFSLVFVIFVLRYKIELSSTFFLFILPIFFSFWCVAILINFGSKPRFLCAVNVELNSRLYWKKQNNLTFIYSVQISYTRLLYLSIPAFVRSIGYNCSKLF